MSSIVRFEALLGAYEDSPAVCYVLEIDGFVILLDCGWTDVFDVRLVEPLRNIAKKVDAVLLSHGDVYHLGALPYAVGKLGLQCPVYATLPVYKMGQMSMYDMYQARVNNEDFDVFNLDDVDSAFEKLVPLKYSQHYHLAGKGKGITITAYAAGHTIGGSIWKIRKENEEIVYAVDFNHNKERHLNGGALQFLTRPSLMITDAYNTLYTLPSRKLRDAELLETILSTLRNHGNVLMPTDTASRVLELALLLDQHWIFQKLPYPVVLLTNVSYNTIEFAKSMLEWMSDTVMKTFDAKRENPFEFRYVRMVHSLEDLHKIPEAKLVLTSTASLETGSSRELFLSWCHSDRNTLILTERSFPGSLARSLIENPKPQSLTLTVKRKVLLEGQEKLDFLMRQKAEKQALNEALQKSKKKGFLEDDEDDEELVDQPGGIDEKPVAEIFQHKHDIMSRETDKSQSFFKKTKTYPMFPSFEKKTRFDDYGELIRAEDFAMLESLEAETRRERESDARSKGIETRVEVEDIPIPEKSVSREMHFDVRMKLCFIDMEGLIDGRSIKHTLAQINPKKLILVHAGEEATHHLRDHCAKSPELTDTLYAPHLFELVDLSTSLNIYQVKLTDSLVSSLRISKVSDYDLAYIAGQLRLPQLSDESTAVDTSPDKEIPSLPSSETRLVKGDRVNKPTANSTLALATLDLPENMTDTFKAHQPIFVGDIVLAEFRRFLQREGVLVDFIDGALVCNDSVVIRKSEFGNFTFEGLLSEDYYRLRQLFYQQFAIL